MQKWIIGFLASVMFTACNSQEEDSVSRDLTGRRVTYTLEAGSEYDIHGTVVIEEKVDGSPIITVSIEGTEGNIQHPVHLHLGDISTPDAAVYANLTPIIGNIATSATHLQNTADESPITYEELVNLHACIKVHLSASGPAKDVILAGGNIGAAFTSGLANGRTGFAVCQSE